MARFTDEQRQEAIETLHGYLMTDSIIYSVTHSVSRGNMGGNYRFFIIREDSTGTPRPFNITWHIARATGHTLKDKDGQWVIYVGGCGFNRPWQVVYDLSMKLFGDGYALTHNDL